MQSIESSTAANGRPAGEVRQALLQACAQLQSPERAPTVRELAAAAKVSLKAATQTVKNLKRAGLLNIARQRKVAYRNRPVAEYTPSAPWAAGLGHRSGFADLAAVVHSWGR